MDFRPSDTTQELTANHGLQYMLLPRQLILGALKSDGAGTAEQLSVSTHQRAGSVRQHLLVLMSQGLVNYERVRSGAGRPRHVYSLTSAGEALFPRLYSELANIILSAVEQESPAVAQRIFGRLLAEQIEATRASVQAPGHEERLNELASLMEQNGFFPKLEVSADAPSVLAFRHCPVITVASEHPRLCEIECEALKNALPGASVVRTAHRLDGDEDCRYEIALDSD
ncbi:MAG: helix-turn-helix transcriptional regulator [Dehalococcoidia bacterium]